MHYRSGGLEYGTRLKLRHDLRLEKVVVSRVLQLKVFDLGSVCIQYQGTLTVNSTNKIIYLIAVLQLSLHDY